MRVILAEAVGIGAWAAYIGLFVIAPEEDPVRTYHLIGSIAFALVSLGAMLLARKWGGAVSLPQDETVELPAAVLSFFAGIVIASQLDLGKFWNFAVFMVTFFVVLQPLRDALSWIRKRMGFRGTGSLPPGFDRVE